MQKENKLIKHFNCKNCVKCDELIFINNLKFCFGRVIKKLNSKDFYRYCVIRDNKKNSTDLMKLEVEGMIQGLATILLQKDIKDINKQAQKRRTK